MEDNSIFDKAKLANELFIKRRMSGKIGVREAAKIIGISPATVSRIENEKSCEVESFLRCCIWLKAKAETFIKNKTTV